MGIGGGLTSEYDAENHLVSLGIEEAYYSWIAPERVSSLLHEFCSTQCGRVCGNDENEDLENLQEQASFPYQTLQHD